MGLSNKEGFTRNRDKTCSKTQELRYIKQSLTVSPSFGNSFANSVCNVTSDLFRHNKKAFFSHLMKQEDDVHLKFKNILFLLQPW